MGNQRRRLYDSQFDELQDTIKRAVMGHQGSCFLGNEWSAYCIDYLMYEKFCKYFPLLEVWPRLTTCSWWREESVSFR